MLYRGENVIETFLHKLKEEESWINEIKSRVEPVNMSEGDFEYFYTSNICHICEQPIQEQKVLDHCHISGRFRGPACNSCNLNYRYKQHICCVFHNFRGYDSHVLLNGIRAQIKNITVIPYNMEKYLSFSIGNIRFIDSLQFLNDSLESLTQKLKLKGDENFKHLLKHKGKENIFSDQDNQNPI